MVGMSEGAGRGDGGAINIYLVGDLWDGGGAPYRLKTNA